ncbi:NADPH-dependent aldehyde reductase ARI1 [Vanrija pseudolonga]|uniref:NADPH-dependent aldehyde reductase ARI1 n=1 Tax=Vanrija pseudolonga TaxID=143232 RepID=A0AAF0YAR2_9TREE|nr:NADPH-dependent aldehyde reductase ARI1 [Vanrija pseudolonga]
MQVSNTLTLLMPTVWNTEDVDACERDGAAASGFAKYHASKTLAEKAFWDYFQSDPRAFDGVTILPTVIMGPFQQYTPEGADPSGSAGFLKWLLSPGLPPATNSQSVYNLVDPRDVAHGMVLALTKEKATGNRYVLSAGPHKYPDAKPNTTPEFLQSLQSTAIVYDGSKITRELGLRYRPKLETIRDTMAAF